MYSACRQEQVSMERARCQEDIRSVVLGPLKHHLYPTRTSCSWSLPIHQEGSKKLESQQLGDQGLVSSVVGWLDLFIELYLRGSKS